MKSLLARALRARADPSGRRARAVPGHDRRHRRHGPRRERRRRFPAPRCPSATRPPTSSAPSESDADGRFRGLLLPLGPYRVTVTKSGFGTHVREGLELQVGQTINLPVTLKVSAVQEEVVVTGEAPVIETTRAEGSDRIDERAIQGLPNNGRNFLDFTLLTPGVSIVQGPDGAELTVNGQKGIQNNISVDGADFNNPFFGEQRGGQRPAFTFNMDAIKEVVVVAEGANAEFGRSNGGFVNVVTKSGTNDIHGTAHLYYKNDGLSSAPKRADGTSADKFDFQQFQTGFTLGGPLKKDKAFYFLALDYQDGTSTKQTDSSRIEPRVVNFFSNLGSPNENGADRAHQRRAGVPGQGRLAAEREAPGDGPLQLHLVGAGQRHLRRGLLGHQRQRHRAGLFPRRHRLADLEPVRLPAERVPLPVGEGVAPAPVQRPRHHRPEPAAARHGLRLRQRLPLRHAVLHPGGLLRPALPVQRQPLRHQGAPRDEVRRRVQPGQLQPDLPRLPERPLHLRLHRRLPELRAEPALRRVLRRLHLPERVPARRAPASPARCSSSSSSSASTA